VWRLTFSQDRRTFISDRCPVRIGSGHRAVVGSQTGGLFDGPVAQRSGGERSRQIRDAVVTDPTVALEGTDHPAVPATHAAQLLLPTATVAICYRSVGT
jgi:hypothetical protein